MNIKHTGIREVVVDDIFIVVRGYFDRRPAESLLQPGEHDIPDTHRSNRQIEQRGIEFAKDRGRSLELGKVPESANERVPIRNSIERGDTKSPSPTAEKDFSSGQLCP